MRKEQGCCCNKFSDFGERVLPTGSRIRTDVWARALASSAVGWPLCPFTAHRISVVGFPILAISSSNAGITLGIWSDCVHEEGQVRCDADEEEMQSDDGLETTVGTLSFGPLYVAQISHWRCMVKTHKGIFIGAVWNHDGFGAVVRPEGLLCPRASSY